MIDITRIGTEHSDKAQQENIIIAHKGWYKFSPNIGVGVSDFLDDESRESELLYEVKRNFRDDGIKVEKGNIKNKKIEIDAEYQS